MSRDEVFKNVEMVFREVFDDQSISINDGTTSEDIEDWDSLEHINLIVAIENTFNIKFNMGEVNKFKNVGEMVDSILAKV